MVVVDDGARDRPRLAGQRQIRPVEVIVGERLWQGAHRALERLDLLGGQPPGRLARQPEARAGLQDGRGIEIVRLAAEEGRHAPRIGQRRPPGGVQRPVPPGHGRADRRALAVGLGRQPPPGAHCQVFEQECVSRAPMHRQGRHPQFFQERISPHLAGPRRVREPFEDKGAAIAGDPVESVPVSPPQERHVADRRWHEAHLPEVKPAQRYRHVPAPCATRRVRRPSALPDQRGDVRRSTFRRSTRAPAAGGRRRGTRGS